MLLFTTVSESSHSTRYEHVSASLLPVILYYLRVFSFNVQVNPDNPLAKRYSLLSQFLLIQRLEMQNRNDKQVVILYYLRVFSFNIKAWYCFYSEETLFSIVSESSHSTDLQTVKDVANRSYSLLSQSLLIQLVGKVGRFTPISYSLLSQSLLIQQAEETVNAKVE